MTEQRFGFVGLGAMGAPMAARLHHAGLLRAVWNRTPERARAFADAHPGVCVADDLPMLATQCRAVVLCVSADRDVRAVVDGLLPALPPGSLLVDCSTVAHTTAQAMAEVCAEHDILWLDAPVSGGTEGARQGTLSIMCGGSDAAYAAAQPALAAMGAWVTHMGPAGAGQATKAVNQVLVAAINRAVTEALALGEALDLPMEQVVDVLSAGAAGNWMLANRGKTMLQGQYPLGFKVALHAKDLRICQAMAQQAGIDLPLAEAVLRDYERLAEAGFGDEDISALYRVTRDQI